MRFCMLDARRKNRPTAAWASEAQQARCRSYCDAFGHTVANAVDENGVSGSLEPYRAASGWGRS